MEKEEIEKVLHNIKSRALSLKNACELFLNCEPKEQKEMAKIMEETSRFILEQAKKLNKNINE
ncbi:MAG: hypothetical protein GX447_06920 [Elusimicrobia bacterium]|nr:hypothetical protein [Elusimicrobiota bacterium]